MRTGQKPLKKSAKNVENVNGTIIRVLYADETIISSGWKSLFSPPHWFVEIFEREKRHRKQIAKEIDENSAIPRIYYDNNTNKNLFTSNDHDECMSIFTTFHFISFLFCLSISFEWLPDTTLQIFLGIFLFVSFHFILHETN